MQKQWEREVTMVYKVIKDQENTQLNKGCSKREKKASRIENLFLSGYNKEDQKDNCPAAHTDFKEGSTMEIHADAPPT